MPSPITDLLAARGRYAAGSLNVRILGLACIVALGCAVYGAVMGSFSLAARQALYSAIKVPLLLLVTTGLCVPSFYVVNALLGLAADFGIALRAIPAVFR